MKNVLVIGGDSFIAQKFISANRDYFKIFAISRKKTANHDEFVIDNLFELSESKFENIDVVINFAAIVHQPNIKDKESYELVNYKLPLFLAQMAYKKKCSHFIQMSTIAVYGLASYINSNTVYSPVNYYGEFKLKADAELSKLSKNGFIVTSIRPSMVYGGYNAPGNMNSFIKLVKTNLPLPFKGIDNKRQFLNINNLTQAIKGIIEQKLQGNIILADEESVSSFGLVNTISKALDRKPRCFKLSVFWKVVRIIKPEIARKLIDNLIIENTYSFEALGVKSSSLEDGIKEMILGGNQYKEK